MEDRRVAAPMPMHRRLSQNCVTGVKEERVMDGKSGDW